MKKYKKYNSQTGGYKIDIFDKSGYLCSTDWCKTCKEAVKNYLKKHPTANGIYARFCYQ